ncbi:hypothetical protein TEA_025087 [Camellia sinensis var. sinensis]|uniref:RING-type E3 ubiquitin transferase n=1 Tax=Camellia sinensis var. sinensis TaxID=542762 RepID=A0A4S4E478_CAMSN|nr:hypothetical protein TEA_025087 [Camellia sinensis var. sinensis]
MWNQRGNTGNGNANGNEVIVAIDKDKGSQYALKWAIDHLLSRGQNVTLIHVKQRPSSIPTTMGIQVSLSDVHDGVAKAFKNQVDNQAKELFLPFRAFCTRKDIKCNEIILEDMDVAKVLCDYVRVNLIDTLVVGAPSKNSFVRCPLSGLHTQVVSEFVSSSLPQGIPYVLHKATPLPTIVPMFQPKL